MKQQKDRDIQLPDWVETDWDYETMLDKLHKLWTRRNYNKAHPMVKDEESSAERQTKP